jgi:hypothetical protein
VKSFKLFLLLFILLMVVVCVVACRPRAVQKDEEPLLLLDDDMELSDVTGPVADNSRCHVCHMNYAVEKLAVSHAQANVGCEKCHGASNAHCSDEDNITPPDIMYAPEKINSACKSCHPDAKLGEGKKYCTECHGEHKLSHRTREWDKTTRALIEDDKVRMLEDATQQ